MKPLNRSEWDFSKVPDNELSACFVYEFTRESPAAQGIAQRWEDYFATNKAHHEATGQNHDESGEENRALWTASFDCRPSLPVPLRPRDWQEMLCGVQNTLVHPWQDHPERARAFLKNHLAHNPAAFTGDNRISRLLFNHGCEKLTDTEVAGAPGQPPGVILADAATVTEDGKELVLLVIDWRAYSDSAIHRAVKDWIWRRKRPVGIKAETRSGRGVRESRASGHRKYLELLGAARLRAWNTTGNIKLHMPEAWKWLTAGYRADASVALIERRLGRKCANFLASYKRFFPRDPALPLTIQRIQERTGTTK